MNISSSLIVFGLVLTGHLLPAQNLHLFYTAKLAVVDPLDPQSVTTRGYFLDDTLFEECLVFLTDAGLWLSYCEIDLISKINA